MSETRISQQVAALEQRLADYEANYPALEQENRALTAEVQRLTAERDSWRIEAQTAEAALGAERQDAARLREALERAIEAFGQAERLSRRFAADESRDDRRARALEADAYVDVIGILRAALTAPADPTGGQ